MRIESFLGNDVAQMEAAWEIRRVVFVVGQNVSLAEEIDGHDQDALVQLLAYTDEGVAVGTLRIMPSHDPRMIKIQRVAVLEAARRGGYATALMRWAEVYGREMGFLAVELDAQLTARGLYDALGYVPDGGIFQDAGLDHIHMTRVLT